MRILVVDDNYVNRVQLKTLLGQYGDCDGAVPSFRRSCVHGLAFGRGGHARTELTPVMQAYSSSQRRTRR